MKKRAAGLACFLALTLIACGGGGGGSSNSASSCSGANSTLPMGSDCYPNVDGNYSMTFQASRFTCSDGYSQNVDANTGTLAVSHNGANLNLAFTSSKSQVNEVTVLSESSAYVLMKDGSYSGTANQRFTIKFVSTGTQNTISYSENLTGQFTSTGISVSGTGQYVYEGMGVTCNVLYTGTGTKL
jgi:hypothetical protein